MEIPGLKATYNTDFPCNHSISAPEKALVASPILPSQTSAYTPVVNSEDQSLSTNSQNILPRLGASHQQIWCCFSTWLFRLLMTMTLVPYSLFSPGPSSVVPLLVLSVRQAKLCCSNKQSQYLRGSREQRFLSCIKQYSVKEKLSMMLVTKW